MISAWKGLNVLENVTGCSEVLCFFKQCLCKIVCCSKQCDISGDSFFDFPTAPNSTSSPAGNLVHGTHKVFLPSRCSPNYSTTVVVSDHLSSRSYFYLRVSDPLSSILNRFTSPRPSSHSLSSMNPRPRISSCFSSFSA